MVYPGFRSLIAQNLTNSHRRNGFLTRIKRCLYGFSLLFQRVRPGWGQGEGLGSRFNCLLQYNTLGSACQPRILPKSPSTVDPNCLTLWGVRVYNSRGGVLLCGERAPAFECYLSSGIKPGSQLLLNVTSNLFIKIQFFYQIVFSPTS
jgi:hypothetical protein